MKIIEAKDTVSIAFVGKLDNGAEFMTVTEEKPMLVTLGANELPPSIENALLGKEQGSACKVRVAPEEGYGHRQKELLQTITNQEVIDRLKPKPGMIIHLKVNREGEEHPVPATVMEVNEGSIVVDYNHPLAGHHLTYEIKVLDIEKASK